MLERFEGQDQRTQEVLLPPGRFSVFSKEVRDWVNKVVMERFELRS
jgi:hypothetical protein